LVKEKNKIDKIYLLNIFYYLKTNYYIYIPMMFFITIFSLLFASTYSYQYFHSQYSDIKNILQKKKNNIILLKGDSYKDKVDIVKTISDENQLDYGELPFMKYIHDYDNYGIMNKKFLMINNLFESNFVYTYAEYIMYYFDEKNVFFLHVLDKNQEFIDFMKNKFDVPIISFPTLNRYDYIHEYIRLVYENEYDDDLLKLKFEHIPFEKTSINKVEKIAFLLDKYIENLKYINEYNDAKIEEKLIYYINNF
jgi:hypothetical protein